MIEHLTYFPLSLKIYLFSHCWVHSSVTSIRFSLLIVSFRSSRPFLIFWLLVLHVKRRILQSSTELQFHLLLFKLYQFLLYVFLMYGNSSSGHIWMWELDSEESWVPKNWCFWTVLLEKTLESPLDCKEIQPTHPKGDQSWVFIGRTDAEAETPILWPPHVKSWLIGKDPDAGRDWGQEEKGTTEDEMAGWHHWLDGHEFE